MQDISTVDVPAGTAGGATSREMVSWQIASGRRPSVATVSVATSW